MSESRRALAPAGTQVHARGEPGAASSLHHAFVEADRAEPDALTHGFHTYPARMHYRVARTVIEAFAPERGRLLDPFCGSGTVLVEALRAGARATGTDLSPLALRLTAVKCERRDARGRERFVAAVDAVADASRARVRARKRARAPIPRSEVQWYEPHVLLELAGLQEEIVAVAREDDRRALEMVLSAIVIKFSRQRADTSEEIETKRIGRFVPTEFFARKGRELAERWAALDDELPARVASPRLVLGDARKLPAVLGTRARFDLVLGLPPYGGTYDYAKHHARRLPWLGLRADRLAADEIGSRRGPTDAARGRARWDRELADVLLSIRSMLVPDGLCVLLVGDAELGGERIPADRHLERLAPDAGLEPLAVATQLRPDRRGGPPRGEHLVALAAVARRGKP